MIHTYHVHSSILRFIPQTCPNFIQSFCSRLILLALFSNLTTSLYSCCHPQWFSGLIRWLVTLLLPWPLFSSHLSLSLSESDYAIPWFISIAPNSLWGKEDLTNGPKGSTGLSLWLHPLNLHRSPSLLSSTGLLCYSSDSWGMLSI